MRDIRAKPAGRLREQHIRVDRIHFRRNHLHGAANGKRSGDGGRCGEDCSVEAGFAQAIVSRAVIPVRLVDRDQNLPDGDIAEEDFVAVGIIVRTWCSREREVAQQRPTGAIGVINSADTGHPGAGGKQICGGCSG